MPTNETSSKESFGATAARQIASNGYSMLLETLVMLAIAAYAIVEIRAVKRDVSDKIAASHQAMMAYGKSQGEKLDALTTELTQTTELLAGAIGITLEDYRKNREVIYQQAKAGGKQAFRDYLKAKFGSETPVQAE